MKRSSAEVREPASVSARFPADGPQIFRRDEASSYAWWGNMVVVLGRQPLMAEHVANYRSAIVELHQRYPLGVGLITVVNDTSTPQPSGREALIATFKELWPTISAALFVPNASGFKAAALRSVMGCLILAMGQRDRVKIERSVGAGMPWLATKVLGADAGQLLPMLQQGIQKFCEAESA